MVRTTRFFFLALLLPFSLLLAGCQAVVHEKGTILDPKRVALITVGQTTRAQVKELLGVPTMVNSLRKDRWIYVQDRQFKNVQRTFARVINRVEVTFDERGVVKDIQHNFDDALLDPQTIPEARTQQQWFNWLWSGEYARPAVAGSPSATPSSGGDIPLPTDPPPELSRHTHPWWKFWSSGKE
ncbi:MAG: outer membrane protein assembly factor BamE [Magnetococcus sp. MYC-9]